jgi:hypothetical protein
VYSYDIAASTSGEFYFLYSHWSVAYIKMSQIIFDFDNKMLFRIELIPLQDFKNNRNII